MQRAFELDIPQTLEEICDPTRLALVVYDMQVGIVKQIENGEQITDRVVQVLEAARKAGVRVFFTRHMSLPKELMGVSQFRMAMAWQRVKSANEVKPWFLRDTPGFHLIPEMNPLPSEAIFDAFEANRLTSRCAIAALTPLRSSALPWRSVLNLQCGMALIWATFQWLSRTHAVSVIAMRQDVQLRASNSRAMLSLPTSNQSVPSFGAYNRNRRSGRDRRVRASVLVPCSTKAKCHNVVNGFGAANSFARRYPANPTGADRHNRMDEYLSPGVEKPD